MPANEMNPPKWPVKWLRRLLLPEFTEHLEGDLHELFDERLEAYGYQKAKQLYYWDCLQLMRPSLFKKIIPRSKFTIMLSSHLKIGYRNLIKYKHYTALNLLGLSLGLAASIVLYRVIDYENSYDRFHDNADYIYRVAEYAPEYGVYYETRTPAAAELKASIPDVIKSTKFINPESKWLAVDDKRLSFPMTYVDEDFAEMFSFEVIEGDLLATLRNKGQIAITLDVATAFFGFEDAVGKILSSPGEEKNYVVGAVLKDPPPNSTLDFQMLSSWKDAPDWLKEAGDWHNTFMTTYIQIQDGLDDKSIEDELKGVSDIHFLPNEDNAEFYPIALTDIHNEIAANGDIKSMLLIIALVISLVAFVNFVNLSTAQSLNRVKEVGIRKVMGSQKGELMLQFVLESIMVCLISVITALVLAVLVNDQVNQYFELNITNDLNILLGIAGFLVPVAIAGGTLAGLYPALYLANQRMMNALKGDSKKGSSKALIQKSLIVIQNMSTVVLIAGTIVIWKQIEFMKNQRLNVDTDRAIVVNIDYSSFGDYEKGKEAVRTFYKNFQNESSIEAAGFASHAPGSYSENYNNFEDLGNGFEVHMRQTTVSAEVLPTLGMEIVWGRNLDNTIVSDSASVIINESAFRAYGWKDLENKSLRPSGDKEVYQVVGVVKDYHYQSLEREVQPMIHWNLGKDGMSWRLIVRHAPGRSAQALDFLKSTWQNTGSFVPLNYYFLDSKYNALYLEQEKIGVVTTTFTAVAILLAGLGLFALASYSIRQRRKEIGIRKVMGASIQQITFGLSSRFLTLVFVAIILGIPVIWYGSNQFLQNFSYPMVAGYDIYLLAALGAIFTAIISVMVRAFLAATDNPSHSLRDE